MKKVVVKLDLHDDKAKQKAMKTVSSVAGVDSIEMNMKDKKLTVIGDIDPVVVVTKLKKKKWYAEILTVGPAKEPEKKKEEPKKEEPKKEDEKKKQEEQIAALVKAYEAYNPHLTRYYHVVSMEENPNACVVC